MDRRGRELFEIAGERAIRGEAHDAILAAPAYETSQDAHYPDTAASAGPRSRERPPASRQPWRRRPVFWLAALGLGLSIGAVEEWLRLEGPPPELARLVRKAGFGVDLVTLKGHRFTFDRDIFDALDLDNVKTFAALDTAAVKARIERLPWIDTAEITRVFPGRLDIRVTERTAFAVWSRADRHYLIDKTGRVLGAIAGTSLPDLPHFAGEGAAPGAKEMLDTVARYPEIAHRIALIERVSERRWRLKLTNAATLELPVDGEVGALEALSRDADLSRLVAAGKVTLDFRGPGRVAVRPEAPAAAPPGGEPRTGS
jgi:cell division protein FtsQ